MMCVWHWVTVLGKFSHSVLCHAPRANPHNEPLLNKVKKNISASDTGWLPIRFRNLDYFSKLTCCHAICQMGHDLSKFNSTCHWAPSSRWKSRQGLWPPLLVLNHLNKPFFHCPMINLWPSCPYQVTHQDAPTYVVGLWGDYTTKSFLFSWEIVCKE